MTIRYKHFTPNTSPYNNATSSGGIKCCDAGTINDRSGEYASLYLRTTYQDGQESDYWSGEIGRASCRERV